MIYTSSIEIESTVSRDSLFSIMKTTEEEFKKVSKTVSRKKDMLLVKQLERSLLGKESRKDTSRITFKSNAERNGYVVEIETRYKKTISFYFWDYLVLFLGVIVSLINPVSFALLLFFLGWHCLWRLIAYRIYSGDESKMKNMIDSTLNNIKQNVENRKMIRGCSQ